MQVVVRLQPDPLAALDKWAGNRIRPTYARRGHSAPGRDRAEGEANVNLGWGIVAGAALIAGSIAISHRYEIGTFAGTNGYAGLWRSDNLTGQILYCDRDQTSGAACKAAEIYK